MIQWLKRLLFGEVWFFTYSYDTVDGQMVLVRKSAEMYADAMRILRPRQDPAELGLRFVRTYKRERATYADAMRILHGPPLLGSPFNAEST